MRGCGGSSLASTRHREPKAARCFGVAGGFLAKTAAERFVQGCSDATLLCELLFAWSCPPYRCCLTQQKARNSCNKTCKAKVPTGQDVQQLGVSNNQGYLIWARNRILLVRTPKIDPQLIENSQLTCPSLSHKKRSPLTYLQILSL